MVFGRELGDLLVVALQQVVGPLRGVGQALVVHVTFFLKRFRNTGKMSETFSIRCIAKFGHVFFTPWNSRQRPRGESSVISIYAIYFTRGLLFFLCFLWLFGVLLF